MPTQIRKKHEIQTYAANQGNQKAYAAPQRKAYAANKGKAYAVNQGNQKAYAAPQRKAYAANKGKAYAVNREKHARPNKGKAYAFNRNIRGQQKQRESNKHEIQADKGTACLIAESA